jgi:hypothetical protein
MARHLALIGPSSPRAFLDLTDRGQIANFREGHCAELGAARETHPFTGDAKRRVPPSGRCGASLQPRPFTVVR